MLYLIHISQYVQISPIVTLSYLASNYYIYLFINYKKYAKSYTMFITTINPRSVKASFFLLFASINKALFISKGHPFSISRNKFRKGSNLFPLNGHMWFKNASLTQTTHIVLLKTSGSQKKSWKKAIVNDVYL